MAAPFRATPVIEPPSALRRGIADMFPITGLGVFGVEQPKKRHPSAARFAALKTGHQSAGCPARFKWRAP